MAILLFTSLILISSFIMADARLDKITLICALTFDEPYYDCSKKWIIYQYDVREMKEICGSNLKHIGGCAVYNDTPIPYIKIGTAKQAACYGEPGKYCYTILYHELLHLKCKCDWHKHLDPIIEPRIHVQIVLNGTSYQDEETGIKIQLKKR